MGAEISHRQAGRYTKLTNQFECLTLASVNKLQRLRSLINARGRRDYETSVTAMNISLNWSVL